MEFLNYIRLGATSVWQGIPLRIAVRLDRDPETGELPPVYLGLVSFNDRGVKVVEPISPVRREVDGRHLFELPTDQLPIGAYEIEIYLGEDPPVTGLEDFWLLDRADFRSLIEEECQEEFLASPIFVGGFAV